MPQFPCRHSQCPCSATYRGYCPNHQPYLAKRKEVQGKGRIYNLKKWAVTRKRKLTQDSVCPCGSLATEVDHVTPIEEGGNPWAQDNLQSLCKSCHSAKTNREVRKRKR